MTTAPVPQHMVAMARANEIRFARADLKRQVRNGDLTVHDVLTTMPYCIASLRVYDLLQWPRRRGHLFAVRALTAAGASEFRTVRDLTRRQRAALLNHLTDDSTPRRTP